MASFAGKSAPPGNQGRLYLGGAINKALEMVHQVCRSDVAEVSLAKDGVVDKSIPQAIIGECKAVAFVTSVKAGFVFSGSAGTGLVIAKLPDGTWSGPSSIGSGGVGWGLQVGATKTDSIIIINNESALKAFSGQGQVKLGGNVSVAAGPIGREADASVRAGDGGVAACFTYSFSKGLFAGLALQGAVIKTRNDDNKTYYGRAVTAQDILAGKVQPPADPTLAEMQQILTRVCNEYQTEKEEAQIKRLAGEQAREGMFAQEKQQQQQQKKKPPPVPKKPPVPAKPVAAGGCGNGGGGGVAQPKPFCGSCGTKFPTIDAMFCSSCGNKR